MNNVTYIKSFTLDELRRAYKALIAKVADAAGITIAEYNEEAAYEVDQNHRKFWV